jgi:hypothetical protein
MFNREVTLVRAGKADWPVWEPQSVLGYYSLWRFFFGVEAQLQLNVPLQAVWLAFKRILKWCSISCADDSILLTIVLSL